MSGDGIRGAYRAEDRGSGQCVLLVDDDELVLAATRKLLQVLGYQVCTSSGAQAALDVLQVKADGIAIVVSDINMPGMTGLELARQIDGIWPQTLVLLVSGLPPEASVQDAFPDHHRFLAKPFRVGELDKALCTLLNS